MEPGAFTTLKSLTGENQKSSVINECIDANGFDVLDRTPYSAGQQSGQFLTHQPQVPQIEIEAFELAFID